MRRYVVPQIGTVPLQALKATTLNALYAHLLRDGAARGGGLSPKSVRNVHGILHKALKDAVRWGLVLRNVADQVDPPRKNTPEMQVWTGEQLRRFLDHVRDDRLFAAWMLAATTGMRRGELPGLRWGDVDLTAGRVAIRQASTVVDYGVQTSEPKTKRSRRSVALDPRTLAALRAHRQRQLEKRLLVGSAWQETGLPPVQLTPCL